jgi:hypothetical protein
MFRPLLMISIATTLSSFNVPAQAQSTNACLASQSAVSPRGNLAHERAKGNREQYMRIAIQRWETKVSSQSGGAYADWQNARNKTTRCPSATAQRRWYCSVSGRPCVGGSLASN